MGPRKDAIQDAESTRVLLRLDSAAMIAETNTGWRRGAKSG
jgi:hypothetical protein